MDLSPCLERRRHQLGSARGSRTTASRLGPENHHFALKTSFVTLFPPKRCVYVHASCSYTISTFVLLLSSKKCGGFQKNDSVACASMAIRVTLTCQNSISLLRVWNFNSLSPPLTWVAQLSPTLFSFVRALPMFSPKLVYIPCSYTLELDRHSLSSKSSSCCAWFLLTWRVRRYAEFGRSSHHEGSARCRLAIGYVFL
jgi:hypothetical protein